LRDAIRHALDSGVEADQVRRFFGRTRSGRGLNALIVEWLIDEWQRDTGVIGLDESIDSVD
jgi:hypothetical protein